ncbi:uncharacterized protein Tco025E_07358 [Trypanosoma conorhini]|uniref:Spermidine synthase n=1 Tax=Trypanosoma conorhini TaxID=83891 RepID=A0A422NPU6_9TRYP|nr:uncharacterized protein Tco025E_07358 [Trypanosoma conorhini]RNF07485.1 hypothetical protein Tco025E_07358 [Trypanosoma conorhini]
MSQRISSHTVGQRPRRQYVSKLTEFFFRELDKGLASPYVVLSTGALLALVGWKLMLYYVEPNRQQGAVWRRPQSRVPLSDAHNAFWGLNIGGDGWRGLPAGRHLAETMTETAEEALRRPTLVHSEDSEVRGGRGEALSVACMELSEYDARLGDDVVYRSVHYIQGTTRAAPAALPTGAAAVAGPADAEGSQSAPVTTPTPPAQESAVAEETSSYFSRMPARGASMIHGMVKCRAITSLNNCVPYAGHMESEYARKLMLALGPVHILRDVAQTNFPVRFTVAKEAPVSTLVCGLHSGEVPRWLSTAFPNFHVDVVESDGALARVCRRFLGFQESSNLRLYIADPVEFIRRSALPEVGRRYDLIMLDVGDGAGRVSTRYGRLEFISAVRNSLTGAGCVVAALPNRDGAFLYNMVQNWRMAFAGRTVLLVHCVTSPQTLLMTFQDDAARGKVNLGSVANVEEFKDLLRTTLAHYGPRRVPFDLTGEVSEENFRVLHPGAVYPVAAYLPAGHPQLREVAAAGSRAGTGAWGAWLRRWSGAWLTPAQRADLRGMDR